MKRYKLAIIALVVLSIVPFVAYGSKAIINRSALGSWSDITTPTSTIQYKLGEVIRVNDTSLNAVKTYIYVKAGNALVANGMYMVKYTTDTAANVQAITPATGLIQRVACVAPAAFTVNYYGWVQIEGLCDVNTTTNTTVGYAGRIINGAATCTDIGSATISSTTCGFYTESVYGASTAEIYLLGTYTWVAQI